MRYTILYLFLSIACNIFADNMLIFKGILFNKDGKAIESATIRFYNSENILLKGTTSDNKGHFQCEVPASSKEFRLLITYIGYQDYELHFIANSDIDFKTIMMKPATEMLDDVVVTANQAVRKDNKLMVFPSKEQKHHAYDGFSALSLMMIPGLSVDPFNKTVASKNGSTLLCINGREVTIQEVKALNPKDILRVDFYDGFHQDFPTATSVVDYILVKREHGGMFVGNLNQYLNYMRGDADVAVKLFKKKSEYSFYLNDKYDHFRPHKGENSYIEFGFPTEQITNTIQTLPSSVHNNNLNATVTYSYQTKKSLFDVSARIEKENGRNNNDRKQEYSNSRSLQFVKENTHDDNWGSSLRMSYTRQLENAQAFKLVISGSYNKNKYNRSYRNFDDQTLLDSYISNTDENSYYLRFNALYRKTFNKVHTVMADINYMHKLTRSDYFYENKIKENQLRDIHAIGTLAYNWRINKNNSITLQWAHRLVSIDEEKRSTFDHYITPSAFLTLNLPKQNSIRIQTSLGVTGTKLNYLSSTEQIIDRFQVMRGNPFLKTGTMYDIKLNYTKGFKWGSLGSFFLYEQTNNPIYEMVHYDSERQLFVHSYENGGRKERIIANVDAQFKLIPKMLTWMVAGEYYTGVERDWKKLRVEGIVWGTQLQFMYKNLSANVQYNTSLSYVSRGIVYTNPATLRLNVGYTHKNWHYELGAANPFMNHAIKAEYNNESYNRLVRNYRPGMQTNCFYVNVNYRFNWGKKHTFRNVEVEKEKNSSILKGNNYTGE